MVVSPKLEHFHRSARQQSLSVSVFAHYSSQHQRTNMSAPSSPQQQSTGTLHRHFNLSVTLHDVLPVGDRDDCAQYRDYCAQYRDYYSPVASHSRTSSHSSLPDLIGCSSSSGESSDDDSELPQLQYIEHTAVECIGYR